MFRRWRVLPILTALLGGCAAAAPTGPTVMVLPGLGKSLEQFNADDVACRQWGLQATGWNPPSGAAGSEAAGGTQYSGQEGQWRYDMAYQQCMYSKGHQIPGVPAGYRGVSGAPPASPSAASPPANAPTPSDGSSIPPPPPGPPPPPPPGVTR